MHKIRIVAFLYLAFSSTAFGNEIEKCKKDFIGKGEGFQQLFARHSLLSEQAIDYLEKNTGDLDAITRLSDTQILSGKVRQFYKLHMDLIDDICKEMVGLEDSI